MQDQGHTDTSAILYQEEDASLCAQLYWCYAPGLLTYLRRHLPMQEDAEDLLLDVFIAALEYEPRLATLLEDERRAWLVTVARNKVIDYHRRSRRRSYLPLETAQDTLESAEMTPEATVIHDEEQDRLRSYVQCLPANQQEVLQLRFTNGLRCAEIARVLNKREGAIRTMLSRTLNTVRSFYEQKNQGER